MKHLKVVSTLSVLFVMLFSWVHAFATIVQIPDPNLEAAIREHLKKETGEITVEDMALLTTFAADERNIQVLTGLEYAVNLQRLSLRINQIANVSALSSLTNLRELFLDWNEIEQIAPLATLSNLIVLHMGANRISNISALTGLENLVDLNLNGNRISNISALSNLVNLSNLSLGWNQITDATALSTLINLRGLFFPFNPISDISALSNLTNLDYLNLANNQISNISALGNLTKLENLTLQINLISDIKPLSELINLKELAMAGNLINDISALSDLVNLAFLRLGWNLISDISPLENLVGLKELGVSWNRINDISVLGGLTNLLELYLDDNEISDISILSSLTKLNSLNLERNSLIDISPLVINSNAGGLGSGEDDQVNLKLNFLDITPGTENSQDIDTLIDNGVLVLFEPQATSRLKVFIQPFAALNSGARWRRVGSDNWYRFLESNLPDGEYAIEFKVIPGWNTKPNENVTIQTNHLTTLDVEYTQNNTQYHISVSVADGNGSVSGDKQYIHNDWVTLVATPNQGYVFSHWTEHGVIIPNAGSRYSFYATSVRNLVAHFKAVKNLPGVMMLLLDDE